MKRIQKIEDQVENHEERITRLEILMEKLILEFRDFKEEMREFKEEMREFKEETIRERRRFNKELGRIANKMGTLVEDIFYPGVRPLLSQYFGITSPDFLGNRIIKRRNGREREFDIVAIHDKKVFLFEIKATPRLQYALEFAEKGRAEFYEFFPEYRDYELYLFFGSLVLEDQIISLLTKHGVYALAYREWEYLDILNFEEVSSKY
ncbi:MAG: hypothetical protein RMI93_04340 [Caldimicrobium sp.]|nr:hypothetical protein [Caldimicrobium sp.]MDW8182816.1 hypothetical protein [Caldimicrobium sp.]